MKATWNKYPETSRSGCNSRADVFHGGLKASDIYHWCCGRLNGEWGHMGDQDKPRMGLRSHYEVVEEHEAAGRWAVRLRGLALAFAVPGGDYMSEGADLALFVLVCEVCRQRYTSPVPVSPMQVAVCPKCKKGK